MEKISIPSSDTKRTVAALLDLGRLGQLIVYGTVLPWKDDEFSGWSKHHSMIEQQAAEWLALRKQYPNTPLCIAGDFNSDMGSGRRYGTKQGVTALRHGLEDCNTFCATEPGRFPVGMLDVLPIDHIALPISWQSSCSVTSAWPAETSCLSDHSGMVVEVSF
jgi:endonuclease/exonuclease/phosphatase family metal-dependent hydrolase